MKRTVFIFIVCVLGFSCSSVNRDKREEALQKFNNLPKLEKIEYFNALDSKNQFYILKDYLAGKCFEVPINDVFKFKIDGSIWVDWMVSGPDDLSLVYASGKKEPFIKYVPYQWEVKNQSLILTKTTQFSEYIKIKEEDNLSFQNNDEIIFNKANLSLFQNKIYLTLKNTEQQIGLSVGSCEKWPVMNLD